MLFEPLAMLEGDPLNTALERCFARSVDCFSAYASIAAIVLACCFWAQDPPKTLAEGRNNSLVKTPATPKQTSFQRLIHLFAWAAPTYIYINNAILRCRNFGAVDSDTQHI